jgi:hypothetical protein
VSERQTLLDTIRLGRGTPMAAQAQAKLDAAPDLPHEVVHIWDWFTRLNATRPAGMGMSAISEQEIGWFFRNRGIRPTTWEIEQLVALDHIALEAQHDKNEGTA